MRKWLIVLAFLGLVWTNRALAVEFGEMPFISSTMGMNGGRLCMAEASRGDIGCPTYTPYVDTTNGNVGIGTSSPKGKLSVAGQITVLGQGRNTASTDTNLIFGDFPGGNFKQIYWSQASQRFVADAAFETSGALTVGGAISATSLLVRGAWCGLREMTNSCSGASSSNYTGSNIPCNGTTITASCTYDPEFGGWYPSSCNCPSGFSAVMLLIKCMCVKN